GSSATSLEMAQVLGCSSVLRLVQEIVRARGNESPRLWLVTSGAQPVVPSIDLAVAQAPLWGLGRTIALEHPTLWGGLIDLDPGAPAHKAAKLLAVEVHSPDSADQLAFRQGQRYVARLTHKREVARSAPPYVWRPDGSYLITGGLGDLG